MRVPFIPNTVILLFGVLAAVYLLALRSGYVVPAYSPLPRIDLATQGGWFVDWRLAGLAQDRELCAKVMTPPHAAVSLLAPQSPDARGCGWLNAVSLEEAEGVRLGVSPVSCQVAAALTLWLRDVAQPEAERLLGSRIASIATMGTYSCRNIVGGAFQRYGRLLREVDPGLTLSEHAKANAIDIGGFTLANGETVDVLRDWGSGGGKGEFLRRLHAGACRYFRVTLGPEANREHRNHFHFDRGFLRACR